MAIASANNANPVFVKLIRLQYKFEEVQKLVVQVYDVDTALASQSAALNLGSQDFIGEIECTVAQIMSSRGCSLTQPIKNAGKPGRAKGTVTLHCEEVKNSNALVHLRLSADALDKKVRISFL